MLISRSRNASEVGISTLDWHAELYDETPEGYAMALNSGVDFVDVAANSTMLRQLAETAAEVQPRYCLRVTPRPTFGLGFLLRKQFVQHWAILTSLKRSLTQLGVDFVETLILRGESRGRLHFPPWVYDAAAEAYRQGLCTKVGISHESATAASVRRASEELRRRGVVLSCCVLKLSLLNRRGIGLVQGCRSLGVQVYAVAALGRNELASGRYTAANPTGGEIAVPRFTLAQLLPLQHLHEALASVAAKTRKRVGKPIDTTQVALQWVRSKGASPLCDVTLEVNARALAGCQGWDLVASEAEQLDRAADQVDKSRPRGYRD